jgi:hypothetical protein
MCSEMLGEEDSELGWVTKFGEHAVRKHIMPIVKKRKVILYLFINLSQPL